MKAIKFNIMLAAVALVAVCLSGNAQNKVIYTGEIAKSAQIATEQLIPSDQIPGKYKLLVHNYKLNHLVKELALPVEVNLNADGSITGAYTGRWSVTAGKSYINISLGGETDYKGVMVLQTLEPANTQVPSFTCLRSATGVTIWGYRYAD